MCLAETGVFVRSTVKAVRPSWRILRQRVGNETCVIFDSRWALARSATPNGCRLCLAERKRLRVEHAQKKVRGGCPPWPPKSTRHGAVRRGIDCRGCATIPAKSGCYPITKENNTAATNEPAVARASTVAMITSLRFEGWRSTAGRRNATATPLASPPKCPMWFTLLRNSV